MRDAPKLLDRALCVFSDVRRGEGKRVLLFALNLFALLVSYYILKTVREPLIIATGGAAWKSYAAAAQAVVLVGFVPLYGMIASRLPRRKLLTGVTLFFVVCIELFYFAARLEVPYLGFFFYVWVGIFSVAMIAQFWAFANDLYSREQGERLFPLIALGATVGAVVGAKVAGLLFDSGMNAYSLLHVAAAILALTVVTYQVVDRPGAADVGVEEPLAKGGGFGLVLKSPYLRLIAVVLILLNLVNTTGEYILASMVEDAARAAHDADPSVVVSNWIGAFYADFFVWVNIGTVAVQALLVSRLVKWFGIGGALFALPIVAMGAYGLMLTGVGFGIARWAKTTENLTDYSVMNTAKAMVWLPASREEKYKAKTAIDTFFVRIGDVLAAAVVFMGTTWWAFDRKEFMVLNLVVIPIWALFSLLLVRRYKRLASQAEAAETLAADSA